MSGRSNNGVEDADHKVSDKRYKLNICYQNVGGLNNKITDFREALNFNEKYDVIVLTETNLDDSIPDPTVVGTMKYEVFRKGRCEEHIDKKEGFGVLIAVTKDFLNSKEDRCQLIKSTLQGIENKWILLKDFNIILGALYFPPNDVQRGKKFKEFAKFVKRLSGNYSDYTIIIFGDFNLPKIRWKKKKHMVTPARVPYRLIPLSLYHLAEKKFCQCNYIKNEKKVILDLIFANTDGITVQRSTSPLIKGVKHHPPLEVSLDLGKLKYSGVSNSLSDRRDPISKKSFDTSTVEACKPKSEILIPNEITIQLKNVLDTFTQFKMSVDNLSTTDSSGKIIVIKNCTIEIKKNMDVVGEYLSNIML